MRKFKFEQTNSTPFRGLDGTVILWDGTETNHHILIEAANGLGVPQSVVTTQQAPYQFGASPIRSTFAPRTITFDCAIAVDCRTATGRAQVETIRRDLAKKFSPVGMGFVQKTSALTSDYDTVTGKLSYASDGSTYDRFIDCIPIECNFVNREYKDGFQRFRLVLFCPDPAWYGVEQSSSFNVALGGLSGQYRAVAWSPSLSIYCAVGSGIVATSSDGINWTARTSAIGDWESIAWSPSLSLFCAVQNSTAINCIQTSPDGITWTSRSAPGVNNFIVDIAWSPSLSLFCAVGKVVGTVRIMTSPDGINWTARTSAIGDCESIAWSPSLSLFCAVQNSTAINCIQTSPDGITWTSRSAPGVNNFIVDIAWSPSLSLFCAVGSSLITSPDGINWTARTFPNVPFGNLTAVAWSNELSVFISTANNRVMVSSNGTTWTEKTIGSGLFTGIATGSITNKIVLVCSNDLIYYSKDSNVYTTNFDTTYTFYNQAYSEELGIIVRVGVNIIQTSTDGINWITRSTQSGSWTAITWSPSLSIFCVLRTRSGVTQTSTDGVNWTLGTCQDGSWYDVEWSPFLSLFCAIGPNNVQTSPDGINWTLRTISSGNYYSITWSQELSLFCAVGSGIIKTSPDGITWTSRGATVAYLRSVSWSPALGIFVICADSGSGTDRILTSPDGITWTVRTSTLTSCFSVCWSNLYNIFVISGFNGSTGFCQTSPDGINWTLSTTVTFPGSKIIFMENKGIFSGFSNSLPQSAVSYDGKQWGSIIGGDYYKSITNLGDVQAEFEIDIPINGSETGEKVILSDNFLWDGTGSPPSDHNLVFGTDGLKKGTVTVSTKFNKKLISQFGVSKMDLYQQGTFFSLYVSGSVTNNIYVRNTGTEAGAPTIRWKNRYLGV